MKTITLAVLVALLVCAQPDPLVAQRDGTGQRDQGAGPQGGANGPRGGGGGGLRGAGGGLQGRALGRGRGQQVQGTSVIRGQVTAADTNTPVRRAQVRANSPDTRSARLATTDAAGRFELKDLPAGRWTVTASKGGFVTQQLGQRRSFESVEPITLADGQRFSANFTLSRGSVITGRLSDEFGDPITGARVQVLRSQMSQGRRRLTPVAVNNQTDDTGAFRLFGLAPGDYYVAASLQASPLDASDNPVTYAPTYYPGTGTLAEAQRISVAAGTEQSGISFVLLPVRAVRVSGTVVDSNGSPMQALLNLSSAAQGDEVGLQTGNSARVLPDGTFTIPNVVPGDYVLNVMGRGAANASPEVASLPISVGNDDLTGVTLVTTKGGTIKGTVVADNGGRPPLTTIQISVQPLQPGPGFVRGSQVTSAGAFELTGLVGTQMLRVDRLPDGWVLKSIRANGTDVTERPFEFRGSELVTAQVVLTNRISELSGVVKSKGQPATDASVVLFPDDPAQWLFPTRRVQLARVDKNGVFRVRALPPGQRYLAVAVSYIEQGEYQDPAFLQQMKARATSVTLNDGESKTLDLTVVER